MKSHHLPHPIFQQQNKQNRNEATRSVAFFFTVQVIISRADTHLNTALGGGPSSIERWLRAPKARGNKGFSLLAEILHLLGKPAVNWNLQKQGPCFKSNFIDSQHTDTVHSNDANEFPPAPLVPGAPCPLSPALLGAVIPATPACLCPKPGDGGLLWRCLGGSQTWEPDFRWGNKQQEQPMSVRRTKLPFSCKCLWWCRGWEGGKHRGSYGRQRCCIVSN